MVGIIFVILGTLLWAIDTLIRYPLIFSGISAERIVLTEHFFLTLIFVPLLFKNKSKLWNAKISSFFYFLVIGVFGSAIGTLCFTKAFGLINPSLVILLQKLQPVVAFTLAHFILSEKLKKEFLVYALLAIFGGVLISYQDIFPNLSFSNLSTQLLSQTAMLGYILTLVAVFSWGASTVFGKKLASQGFSEIELMGGRFIFGFIFMAFYAYANFQLIQLDWSPMIWGKILLMVIISGLLGMYFYYKGLKLISAHVCAIAELFFPLSAVVINWVYLGKELTMVQIIGAVILLISSTIIQLKQY